MNTMKLALIGFPMAIWLAVAVAQTSDDLAKESENAMARHDARKIAQHMKDAAEKRAQAYAKLTPQERYCRSRADIDEALAFRFQAAAFRDMVTRTQIFHNAEDHPNPDPQLRDVETRSIKDEIARNQEAMIADANPSCRMRDGTPRISFMIRGYGQAMRAEHDWKKAYETIGYVKAYYGNTPFTQMLEPVYWVQYAWDARGGGYASSISEDGWSLFRQRLLRAKEILTNIKPSAAALPGWYQEMLLVQTGLGASNADLRQTMLEGTARFPGYYFIYLNYLNSILPKWGGNWQEVDDFVRWSVKHTKGTDGDAMYARLYWFATQNSAPDLQLFHDTLASWKKMKQGFEKMLAQYPNSQWNRNGFAAFACIANDKATYTKLRKRIGKQLMHNAWPASVSPDICDHKLNFT